MANDVACGRASLYTGASKLLATMLSEKCVHFIIQLTNQLIEQSRFASFAIASEVVGDLSAT